MPKADTSSTTSRRTLLAAAAPVAPASLLPAIAAAAGEEPDPHVRWAAESDELKRRVRAASGPAADVDRICDLDELIVDTPARTVAGLLAQARVLHDLLDADNSLGLEAVGLRNMLASLERLVGRA